MKKLLLLFLFLLPNLVFAQNQADSLHKVLATLEKNAHFEKDTNYTLNG